MNKVNTIKERIKQDKEEFLKLLSETIGVVSAACQRKGISRTTYYKWYDQDPEFRKKVERIKREQVGYVEDRLLKAIADDNIAAIIFYLKCKHPEFRPRQELTLSADRETIDRALDKLKGLLK